MKYFMHFLNRLAPSLNHPAINFMHSNYFQLQFQFQLKFFRAKIFQLKFFHQLNMRGVENVVFKIAPFYNSIQPSQPLLLITNSFPQNPPNSCTIKHKRKRYNTHIPSSSLFIINSASYWFNRFQFPFAPWF